jgi:hypothetical protein
MLPPFLINQTRWSDLLKSLAVTKGLDHVELLAQLTAAVVLENDRPEHKYSAGEALAWGQFLAAAVALVIRYVGVRNPAGSGKIVVVEHARGIASTTTRMYLALVRDAVLTAEATEQPRDTRLQPTGAFGTAAPNIAGQIVSGRSDTITVVPFVVAELTNYGVNGGDYRWTGSCVLAPGDALLSFISDGAGGSVAGVAHQASFQWRERTLEPTET